MSAQTPGPANRARPRVVVVSEFYPRAADPVLGFWAHRQALATREAGADIRVLVLYRPLPARAKLGEGVGPALSELARLVRQPLLQERDGLEVRYVPFVSPERSRAYARWGAWAAPPLTLALRALRRRFAYELIHAHNAVPVGDAVLRARVDVPLVVSVHGGDVLFTAPRVRGGAAAVARTLSAARLVLANSRGVADLAAQHGARAVRVVPLGADPPPDRSSDPPARSDPERGPVLITVGHLVARKRHADVIRALALLASRHPGLGYRIVGDGPEREPLRALAAQLGVSDRVELVGQLEPDAARAALGGADLFVMPSTEEALGIAYLEAMAAGVPAIGAAGEPGPQEISAAGEGMRLVAAQDPTALAAEIGALVGDPQGRERLGRAGAETVARAFSWERCGRETVEAYRQALA